MVTQGGRKPSRAEPSQPEETMKARTPETCYYCKHLQAYGWHQWGCRRTDEETDRNATCPNWEEPD